jgi:protoporphyrinogen oxidase
LSGLSVLVLERGLRVGGGSGSVRRAGFTFDHSGHLLHLHDPYGKKLALELLSGNVAVLERSAWIHMQGRYTRYPFQANTYGLPVATAADCLAGYLRTVYHPAPSPGRPESFADWSRRQFGSGICRHFMYPYNRKLWRLPLSELTVEWQGRFLPKPQPAEVLCGAL